MRTRCILAVIFGLLVAFAVQADEPSPVDAETRKKQLQTLIMALNDPARPLTTLKKLACLGDEAKPAVPAIEAMLKHEKEAVRTAAVDVLIRIGAVDRVLPLLLDAIKVRDQAEAVLAAERLGRIGPEAKDAVPELEAKLKLNNPEWRCTAALALARIVPGHKSAIQSLIDDVEDGGELLQLRAAKSLGDIGPDARAALTSLRKLAASSQEAPSKLVREAIEKIEQK